jgi:hypothetical protein
MNAVQRVEMTPGRTTSGDASPQGNAIMRLANALFPAEFMCGPDDFGTSERHSRQLSRNKAGPSPAEKLTDAVNNIVEVHCL